MALDLDEFAKLKRNLERDKAEAARLEGALGKELERLIDEFGCADEVEGQALADQWKHEIATEERKYKRDCDLLKDEYPQLFR